MIFVFIFTSVICVTRFNWLETCESFRVCHCCGHSAWEFRKEIKNIDDFIVNLIFFSLSSLFRLNFIIQSTYRHIHSFRTRWTPSRHDLWGSLYKEAWSKVWYTAQFLGIWWISTEKKEATLFPELEPYI